MEARARRVDAPLTREAVTAWPELVASYREARAGKRRTPAVDAWFGQWETELLALQDALRAGYHFGPYQTFTVRDVKPRLIAAAPFRDRVVHHAMVRAMGPAIERRLTDACVACRVGRGGTEARRRLLAACRSTKAVWYAKCDIRGYFASIRHDVLLRQLLPRCGDAWAEALVADLVGSWNAEGAPGRGIPIGNLTSQLFANAHLAGVDQYMQRTAGARGYLRYVDDMVWFADDRDVLRRQVDQLGRRLDALGLALHPRKTRIGRVCDGVDFVGLVATARTMRVRPATKRRSLRHLRALRRKWRAGEATLGRYLEGMQSTVALFEAARAKGLLAARGLAW